MTPRFEAIGIVVSDMARAIAFYRELGLEFPEGAETEGHAEATAAGVRFMLDTEEMVRSFDPEWQPPGAGAPKRARVSLRHARRSGLGLREPARARRDRPQGAVGRVLGHAVRGSEGSGRKRRGSVRGSLVRTRFDAEDDRPGGSSHRDSLRRHAATRGWRNPQGRPHRWTLRHGLVTISHDPKAPSAPTWTSSRGGGRSPSAFAPSRSSSEPARCRKVQPARRLRSSSLVQ